MSLYSISDTSEEDYPATYQPQNQSPLHRPVFRRIPQTPDPTASRVFRTLTIHRYKPPNIFKKYYFDLMDGTRVLRTAKSKHSNVGNIYLANGPSVRIKLHVYDHLLICENRKSFTLKEQSGRTDVLMKTTITPKTKDKPRSISIVLSRPPQGCPNVLETREPKQNPILKVWILDFKGKKAVSSRKNCIFDGNDVRDAIMIRKVEKDAIEIDYKLPFEESILFALGIISFLGS